jgi:hypothetical protein
MAQITDSTALKNHMVYYFLMPAGAIPQVISVNTIYNYAV